VYGDEGEVIDEQELTMTAMPKDMGHLNEYEVHIGMSESSAAAE
jgi:hypothetical protein